MHNYDTSNRYSFNNNMRNFRDSSGTYNTGMNNIANAAAGHITGVPTLPLQKFEREGFLYNQHDFPKLKSAEDTRFSQMSHDIRQMKDSIEYFLQTSRNDQHKNGFEQVHGGYSNNNERRNSPMQNQTQFGDAKNFQRQNQFYPEQDHYQQ
jgi:hypothetical protein